MTPSRSGTRSRPKHQRRPPAPRRYPQTANSGSAMKVTFCVRGVLSPLLSNLVLDDLDKELTRRGHRFCRYADDCNIYVRSRKEEPPCEASCAPRPAQMPKPVKHCSGG